jgi:uncharacterized protein (TIGR02996 family)
MSGDRSAFIRAITDQPADRTARLVFADFLEETGSPADAVLGQFIRAQVEAEIVHPNSARAAELETLARELFSAHWLDWWGETCAAIGLPPPQRLTGVRGWLARRVAPRLSLTGTPPAIGYPYAIAQRGVDIRISDEARPARRPLDVLHHVLFRGGFPEELSFLGEPGFGAEFLRRWADAAPLAALHLHGIVGRDWQAIDGPHLNGLRTLTLAQGANGVLSVVAASGHLARLETLNLVPDRANFLWPPEQYREFAASPLAARVTRLSAVLGNVTEALALRPALRENLTALEVRAPRALYVTEGSDGAIRATASLLALPHLPQLEELVLDEITSGALTDIDPFVLRRVRRLELKVDPDARPGQPIGPGVVAPALTDLSLTIRFWSDQWLEALAESAFLVRLQHLHLDGILTPNRTGTAAVRRLARALNPDRIETLRLGAAMCPSPAVQSALVQRFGDRVRFV